MPDLLTHLATAHLVRRTAEFSQQRAFLPQAYTIFYCGSILPDLLVKPLAIMFPQQGLYWLTSPTHLPFVFVWVNYAIALCFREQVRRQFFRLLMLGGGLHCLLDVCQRHLASGAAYASGAYYWLFPFSWQTFSLPLFWASDSILALPFLVGSIAAVEIFYKHWNRKHA